MDNRLMVKVRKLDSMVYGVTEDYRFAAIAHDSWELKRLMQAETSMNVELVDMFPTNTSN